MRKALKEELLRAKGQAAAFAAALSGGGVMDRAQFSALFRAYLCAKFMLEPDEIQTDDFYAICQLSAEKAARFPKGALDAAELASKCGGATTAMNKKVLFLMALKRELNIDISPEEGAAVDRLSQLVALVYEKCGYGK